MMLERTLHIHFTNFLAVGERAHRMLVGEAASIDGVGRRLRGVFGQLWTRAFVWALFYYIMCLGLVSPC